MKVDLFQMVTEALGWTLPVDELGKWKKTSLKPEMCTGDQVFHLDNPETVEDKTNEKIEDDHITEWLCE